MAEQAFGKCLLLFDGVLECHQNQDQSIMLPEKSQGKVLQATLVAVGPGTKGKGGGIQAASVKVGDKVLLPEIIIIDDKDYFLFRDGDIFGKHVN
nr:10 kDa heat shock protein, mitochondrial-like [Peromyscus maniculatus bairdii]